jgi:hypothetical protein
VFAPVALGRAQTGAILSDGLMKAPMIHRIGKKIPKKNIHPWPFLSVITPSVTAIKKYRNAAPIPIPHHMM